MLGVGWGGGAVGWGMKLFKDLEEQAMAVLEDHQKAQVERLCNGQCFGMGGGGAGTELYINLVLATTAEGVGWGGGGNTYRKYKLHWSLTCGGGVQGPNNLVLAATAEGVGWGGGGNTNRK